LQTLDVEETRPPVRREIPELTGPVPKLEGMDRGSRNASRAEIGPRALAI
jgi:hypothetical protein